MKYTIVYACFTCTWIRVVLVCLAGIGTVRRFGMQFPRKSSISDQLLERQDRFEEQENGRLRYRQELCTHHYY